MPRVSEILRAVRLEKGISLHQVEEATKIWVKHLEALERGEYGAIPGRVYARGFVRSYAVFLGLNVQALDIRFNQDYPPPEDEETKKRVAWARWPFSGWKLFR